MMTLSYALHSGWTLDTLKYDGPLSRVIKDHHFALCIRDIEEVTAA